jgi:hypothetical protein
MRIFVRAGKCLVRWRCSRLGNFAAYIHLNQPCANGNLHFVGEGKSGKLLCHGT